MSRFQRGTEPAKEAPEKPKPDKKKAKPWVIEAKVTERESEICRYYTAKKMLACFGYRKWMSNKNVIGPNGERIRPHAVTTDLG